MLEVKGLSKSYPSKTDRGGALAITPVLQQLSLEVNREEFVCLLGPSGCGKSTLLNLISGLEKPEEGHIFFNGQEITGQRGHVAYMMQKDLLFPWRTVLDNCILGMELAGCPRRECRQKAAQLLQEFALAEYSQNYPYSLSGGMRQRIAFLRTMLANKEILLLDEPFGSLDAYTKREMQEWLLAVWQKYRLTIFFVTHDLEEALVLADRIYVFSPRPAKVALLLANNLPRPRTQEVLVGGEFNHLKKQLLQTLF